MSNENINVIAEENVKNDNEVIDYKYIGALIALPILFFIYSKYGITNQKEIKEELIVQDNYIIVDGERRNGTYKTIKIENGKVIHTFTENKSD